MIASYLCFLALLTSVTCLVCLLYQILRSSRAGARQGHTAKHSIWLSSTRYKTCPWVKRPLIIPVPDKCKEPFDSLNVHVIKAGLFSFPFSHGKKFTAWHDSWCRRKNSNALSIYSKPQEFLRPQPNFRDKKAFVQEGWTWLLGSKTPRSVFWKKSFHMALAVVTLDRGQGASNFCGALHSFRAQSCPIWTRLCTCFCQSAWAPPCQTFPPPQAVVLRRGSGKGPGALSRRRADTQTQVYLELTHSLNLKEKVGLEILLTNMILNLVWSTFVFG